jgi:murein DD-endopeptidase MepM/ murein hydrolase activator NlpD
VQWPIVGALNAGAITQRWHPSKGTKGEPGYKGAHWGVDIEAPVWTPVRAVAAGTVARAFEAPGGGCMIVVEHDDSGAKWWSEYLHLSAFAVEKGDAVAEGDVIALSGNSGAKSSGAHLHLQVRVSGAWLKSRKLKAGTELAKLPTKKGGVVYFVNPTILVLPPPVPLPAMSGLQRMAYYRTAGVGAAAPGRPTWFKIKKRCQWEGRKAAGELIVGGVLVAALLGWIALPK